MNKIIITGFLLVTTVVLVGCQTNVQNNTIEDNGIVEKKQQSSVQEKKQDNSKLTGEVENLGKQLGDSEQSRKDKPINKNLNQQNNQNNTMSKENIDMKLAKTCQEAVLKTSMGDITIKLDGEKAPTTVANFCTLAKQGFYKGVKFHRVIDGFMIQTGDPKSKDDNLKGDWGTGDPGYKFKDELPKAGEYKIGSVAMANSGPNTNGSQFFIVTGQSGVGLPPLYSLFGQVTKGLEVIDKIQKVETEEKGIKDRPIQPVVIESVEVKTIK